MHIAILPGVAIVKILENDLWIVVKVVGSKPIKNFWKGAFQVFCMKSRAHVNNSLCQ